MKYKEGDRVKIKSLDWYNENKDADGFVRCGDRVFDDYMSVFCGSVVTIGRVYTYTGYDIREDMRYRTWTDEMIEELVEHIDCKKCGLSLNSLRCLFMDNCPHNQPKHTIEIPKGWIPKDENGNVINATKIVLEKKKKEYPKTFEECVHVLEGENRMSLEQMNTFRKLIDARNAYWKLYGEEMGLGKPWQPSGNEDCFVISRSCGEVFLLESAGGCEPFEFPTKEMRDAFKENFDKDLEFCKELL